jgi:hypothetical protein
MVNFFGCLDRGPEDDSYLYLRRIVEGSCDGLGMSGYLLQCCFSIKVLAAGDEPDLEFF